jgi:hypothetical protein
MGMPKLTLNVDKTVLARAKRYAKKRGVSVSHIVQEYLDVVGGAAEATASPAVSSPANPSVKQDALVLRSLRGILKSANLQDYERTKRRFQERMHNAPNLGTKGVISWTRDEIHER